jgi:hypothetical protein
MIFASAKKPDREAFCRELDALVKVWPECAGYVAGLSREGLPKAFP